jgi:hypothetical protein
MRQCVEGVRRRAGSARVAITLRLAASVLTLGAASAMFGADVSSGSASATEPNALQQHQPRLQQKALDILKAASDKLAAAKTLSFSALIEEEGPALDSALPLQFSMTAKVALQRPDRLFVQTRGAGQATEFFYDGKTMTAWMPEQNLVAVAPAPPSIDAMLEAAYDTAAIYFPFTDLIVTDPYKDLVDGLTVAFYMGRSDVVAGTTTDMIAFGNDGVFVQAWIGADDNLPRRLRAVFLDDPATLRHDLVLSDWKLGARLPPVTFVARSAAGAPKIPFEHPVATVPARAPADSDKPTQQ